ncbi:hypothetical protein CBM2609_B40039 [Cupriavidus taiwanensis]|nr:hypothetical protein CBM2604_B50038 [Cupriavidus taiwanensis]SOZ32856.1 hypothetical protein CBM2609_B40039 [Cupriavidus taiwanensis]SOZ48278.1 hypothetical protein CBM2610_B40038 [Cupriavidus taiwanensis]
MRVLGTPEKAALMGNAVQLATVVPAEAGIQ